MTINQAAFDLIKASEGFRANAYVDPGTGGEPLTIAWGHTSAAGPPRVTMGMVVTESEGEAILRQDLANTEATVKQLVKVSLNENQYGALVSFAFNVGGGNFATSTLLRLLNAGEYAQAAAEFFKWNHAAGKVLPGLTVRRNAEAKLFSTPIANKPAPQPFPPLPRPTPIPPVKTPPAVHPAVPTTIGAVVVLGGAGAISAGVPWPWLGAAVIVLGIGGYVAITLIRSRKAK